MKTRRIVSLALVAASLTLPIAARADTPGVWLEGTIERLPPTRSEVNERHARMRAAGTALLTIGATLIPTTAALWTFHAPGHDLCFDGCSDSPPSNASIDAAFGTALVLEHVMVGAGRGILTAGYGPSGSERVGPTLSIGASLRITGGVLVALASVALPLGIAFSGEDFGLPMTGVGAVLLCAGVPIASLGSYYDNTKNPVSVGASPMVRGAGDPPGRAVAGMVTTVSGRF